MRGVIFRRARVQLVAPATMGTIEMDTERRAYRIDEFCAAHGIGASKFHEEASSAA